MNAQQEEERREKVGAAWVLGFGAGTVVLVLLAIAYTVGFNTGKGRGGGEPAGGGTSIEKPGGKVQPAPAGPGRELFISNCASCHTLAAAGATGAVGPNLDDLQPDQAQVQSAIQIGGTGSGVMPTGLLQGKQAEEVAAYVAGSAGG